MISRGFRPWLWLFLACALAPASADSEIGRLLDALEAEGLERNTLVLVTGDHGEGLMTHGLPHHGVHIYEEEVRVPLVIRHPGRIEPGTVVVEPVGLVDLAPTILDLVGVPIPAGVRVHGRSLAAALQGRARLAPERPVYLHRRHYEPGRVSHIPVAGEKFGVRVGAWKYIEGEAEGTRELFDLGNDPGERVNLYEPTHEAALSLQSRLREWSLRDGRERGAQSSPSADDLKRLRSLGYVQ
jgi:arylsulfatase A-like enzyme